MMLVLCCAIVLVSLIFCWGDDVDDVAGLRFCQVYLFMCVTVFWISVWCSLFPYGTALTNSMRGWCSIGCCFYNTFCFCWMYVLRFLVIRVQRLLRSDEHGFVFLFFCVVLWMLFVAFLKTRILFCMFWWIIFVVLVCLCSFQFRSCEPLYESIRR